MTKLDIATALRRALLTTTSMGSAAAVLLNTVAASADSLADLEAAAKKEGQLTVIALPHDWCGYGAVIDGFKAKYGLTVNELNPDAGSGDEIEAIKANKGNTGPQAPDVIDVGLSFGPSAKAEGLLQPYKVAKWDEIPDSAKDADGNWYGDYYGVMAFEINKDLVKESPADWADLSKSDYANSVALAGEFSAVYPRRSPGGWQLIGRTDAVLWDLDRSDPALLTQGMWVQFRAV